MQQQTTIERAFDLAQSGECENIQDIRARLKAEDHEQVDAHLAGPAIKKQLTKICERSRSAGEAGAEELAPVQAAAPAGTPAA